ncbi:MAG: hypothetical protein HDR82_09960 [Bacteroides sp.]|nr:hypothetical protein [Bacteroides sp.]
MTQKEALTRINDIIGRNEDVTLHRDQILGKTYALTINGHEKGWLKSGYRKPVELLAWLEGVCAVYPYPFNWQPWRMAFAN